MRAAPPDGALERPSWSRSTPDRHVGRSAKCVVVALLLAMLAAVVPAAAGRGRQSGTGDHGVSVTLRRPASASDKSLEPVFARIRDYLSSYLAAYSSVVAEEDYVQVASGVARVFGEIQPTRSTRHLVSDLLLVRIQGADAWIPFRDVLTVDGQAVHDRPDRLRRLFLDEPGKAMQEAWRITEESARYNIGTIHRTLNLPTLPLVFLMPEHVLGFSFRRGPEEKVGGTCALRLDYEEKRRPTVMRRSESNEDMPARGALWVDPSTGRILKTRVETSDGVFRMSATVVYQPGEALGLWIPAAMEETYVQSDETIRGTATYRNFRRFQVTTEEQIRVPRH